MDIYNTHTRTQAQSFSNTNATNNPAPAPKQIPQTVLLTSSHPQHPQACRAPPPLLLCPTTSNLPNFILTNKLNKKTKTKKKKYLKNKKTAFVLFHYFRLEIFRVSVCSTFLSSSSNLLRYISLLCSFSRERKMVKKRIKAKPFGIL